MSRQITDWALEGVLTKGGCIKKEKSRMRICDFLCFSVVNSPAPGGIFFKSLAGVLPAIPWVC